MALSWTLFWLPLTFAAVGRAAWLKYRFTDKRLSVITNSPFRSQQVDVAYQEIKDVVTVGRGVGLWGDMLFVLRNGDKVEMRAVPRWLELKNYINER